MSREAPITAAQQWLHRHWLLWAPVYILLVLIFLVGVAATLLGLRLLWQVSQNRTPHYADIVEHFKYASIGAEPHSGIPYRIWRVLPEGTQPHADGKWPLSKLTSDELVDLLGHRNAWYRREARISSNSRCATGNSA